MNSRYIVLLVAAVFLFLATVLGLSVANEEYTVLVLFLVIGGWLLSLVNPRLLTYGAVALFSTGMTLPQLQGKLSFFHLAAAGLLMMVVIRKTLHQKTEIPWSNAHAWLLIFAGVVVVTMAVRGAGLRVLGSDKWGGLFYVQLFLCMSTIFTIPALNLPQGSWRTALLCYLGGAMLPAFSEALFLLSGGRTSFLFLFISPSGGIFDVMAGLQSGTTDIVRFVSASAAGVSLLLMLLIFVPIKQLTSMKGAPFWPVILLAFVVAGLGGYRGVLLNMAFLLFILFIWEKCLDGLRLILIVNVVAICYSLALLFATDLPSQFQRMLSILPGVKVEGYIRADVDRSVDWRLELWERGVKLVPQYWLVGKGYAFNAEELFRARESTRFFNDEFEWAIVGNNFHQGPLSLMIGFGTIGLVSGLTIFYLFCRRHYKMHDLEWRDARLRLAHQVFTAQLIGSCASFILIFGDVQSSFPGILFNIALLEGIAAAGTYQNGPARGNRVSERRKDTESSDLRPVLS